MRFGIRLWQRDADVLRECARCALTNRQIKVLVGFSSVKKAAERTHELWLAGFLKRVPSFQNKQGNAELLHYVSSRRPEPVLHAHTIAVGDLRVLVAQLLQCLPEFSAEFLYGHELPPTLGLGLIPDAGLLLARQGKGSLTFFEIDRGTESLASVSRYSVAKKLGNYAEYFDGRGAERDFSFWPGTLRGFRVAFVVPSGRLHYLQHLVSQGQHDFCIMTTFDLLKEGLQQPIWKTHDGLAVDLLGRRGA